jgi:hypothetical protein
MATDSRPDDARGAGDALDRAIDDALEASLRTGPVDLRAQVLARLDNPVDERPPGRFVLFHPALLPVAGAALVIIAVAVVWQQADSQLSRAGAPPARTNAARMSVPTVPTATTARSTAALVVIPARTTDVSPTPTFATAAPARSEHRPLRPDDRIVASSWLAMDGLSRPTFVAADRVFAGDDDFEPFLPGAPAGDLGDPIAPMPQPLPIVIPPIVAAPIVDAPPVSTLATPVSTLSTDDISRGRTDPGKPGGVRP